MFRSNIKSLSSLAILVAFCTITSCNKLPVVEPVVPVVTTNTIGDVINSTATFSILKAAVTKAGLLPLLSKQGGTFTVFAPDDAAFTASGYSLAVVNGADAATLRGLLSYHVIPSVIPSSAIPTTFPNVQMPTMISLQAPFVTMSIFPSKRGNAAWANNIPITQTDIAASNGVIHKVAFLVAPPMLTVRQIINSDTSLSFLRAAINRADSGQVNLGRFDSVINYALANVTLFAPTNNAFRNTLGIPDSSFFRNLPVLTVRGIVAYHLLGSRAFVANLPTTTTGIQTLIGTAPLLSVDWSTSVLKLKGAGNGPALFGLVTSDRNAINGVVHSIDGVLRPQ